MSGYPIATEALDLEVYLLAALFAGSQTLSNIEDDHRSLLWARRTFESSEISRRLIGVAVMFRNQIQGSGRVLVATVGTLMADVSQPTKHKPFSVQEACNKVIHAEVGNLASGPWEQSSTPPVSSTVILEGTYNGMNWQAQLDVLAFLNAACEQF